MAIKDLPDEEMRFVKAGTVRLGTKKTNKAGVEYPVEADHFVLKDAPDLIPLYGAEPKELLITLPYPELERNFRVYYEEFRRGGLYCQGDGERINWCIDPNGSGEVVVRDGMAIMDYQEEDGSQRAMGEIVPCPGKKKDLFPRCQNCRMRALLFFLVRHPKQPQRFVNDRLAYYRLSTGSLRNYLELRGNLLTIQRMAAYIGREITFLPMILRRVPAMVSVQTDKGRSQVNKWFLQLEVDPAFVSAASLRLSESVMAPIPSLPELVNGEVPEEDEVIDLDGEELYASDLEESLGQTDQIIANLDSLRDELPTSPKMGLTLLEEVMGDLYDQGAILRHLRSAFEVPRMKPIPHTLQVWQVAVDYAIGILRTGYE